MSCIWKYCYEFFSAESVWNNHVVYENVTYEVKTIWQTVNEYLILKKPKTKNNLVLW